MIRTLLVAVLLASPVAARAFTLSLDADAAWVTDSHVKNNSGLGLDLRLGNEVAIPEVRLTIEVGGGLRGFSTDKPSGIDTTLYQVFGGARLSVGELIRPGLYGHVGYGWATGGGNSNGLYLEGGVFADLALPIVSVGVHAAYQSFISGSFNELLPSSTGTAILQQVRPDMVLVGIHGALTF